MLLTFEGLQIKDKNISWDEFSTAVNFNMQAKMFPKKEKEKRFCFSRGCG